MTLDHATMLSLADQLEAMDALYRFGAAVDHNDADLLGTASSDDATVDFSPCGRAMGLDFPVLTGGPFLASTTSFAASLPARVYQAAIIDDRASGTLADHRGLRSVLVAPQPRVSSR